MARNTQTRPAVKAPVKPTTETVDGAKAAEQIDGAGEATEVVEGDQTGEQAEQNSGAGGETAGSVGASSEKTEETPVPGATAEELAVLVRASLGASQEDWDALEDGERNKLIEAYVEASKPVAKGEDALLGSSTIAAIVVIDGADVSLGDLVAAAHTASGLSVDDWNALDDRERDKLIQEQVDKRIEAAKPVEIDTSVVDDGSTPDVHIESDDDDHQEQEVAEPRRTLTKAFQNAKARALSKGDHAAYAAFNSVEIAAGEFRRAMAAAGPHVEAADDDGFTAEIVADVLRSF